MSFVKLEGNEKDIFDRKWNTYLDMESTFGRKCVNYDKLLGTFTPYERYSEDYIETFAPIVREAFRYRSFNDIYSLTISLDSAYLTSLDIGSNCILKMLTTDDRFDLVKEGKDMINSLKEELEKTTVIDQNTSSITSAYQSYEIFNILSMIVGGMTIANKYIDRTSKSEYEINCLAAELYSHIFDCGILSCRFFDAGNNHGDARRNFIIEMCDSLMCYSANAIHYAEEIKKNYPFYTKFPLIISNTKIPSSEKSAFLKKVFTQKDMHRYISDMRSKITNFSELVEFIKVTTIDNNRVKNKDEQISKILLRFFVGTEHEGFAINLDSFAKIEGFEDFYNNYMKIYLSPEFLARNTTERRLNSYYTSGDKNNNIKKLIMFYISKEDDPVKKMSIARVIPEFTENILTGIFVEEFNKHKDCGNPLAEMNPKIIEIVIDSYFRGRSSKKEGDSMKINLYEFNTDRVFSDCIRNVDNRRNSGEERLVREDFLSAIGVLEKMDSPLIVSACEFTRNFEFNYNSEVFNCSTAEYRRTGTTPSNRSYYSYSSFDSDGMFNSIKTLLFDNLHGKNLANVLHFNRGMLLNTFISEKALDNRYNFNTYAIKEIDVSANIIKYMASLHDSERGNDPDVKNEIMEFLGLFHKEDIMDSYFAGMTKVVEYMNSRERNKSGTDSYIYAQQCLFSELYKCSIAWEGFDAATEMVNKLNSTVESIKIIASM